MDDLQYIANIEQLEGIENERIRQNRYVNINPFEVLNEQEFIAIFRLSKELCRSLIDMLEPFMRPQRRATDFDVATRVLVALRFFASGSYQMDIGKNLFLAVSQPSVSRCIKEVTIALNEPEIFNEWIHFPRTVNELNEVRLGYYEKFQFPGIIGCIDCTHVAIFPPSITDEEHPEHLYVNRKGYHSINVQLICDSNLKIINVNARYPGSTNDAFIWTNSNVLQLLRNLHGRGHTDYYLLGDSGYPLRSWLLTPLEIEPAENTPEYRYNLAHKRTRNIIERCNGLLKLRFRCLLKHRVVHYKPDVACRIINSCVVLHNMCIGNNVEMADEALEDQIDFGIIQDNNNDNENNNDIPVRRVNPELAEGRRRRNQIINNVFRNRH